MRRVHLFEWEDQPWLPRVFRDFITDHLRYTHNEAMREPVNLAIARHLASLLARTRTSRIVDLCAGAGGPLPRIGRVLREDLSVPVEILLTDLYPNVAAFKTLEALSGGFVRARYESTSAADVPADLHGLRTLFTALHHFQPAQARLILADAVRKRQPIAVFEPLERTVRMVALVGLMSFLRGLTHTHRVGRLTFQRAVVTYLLPLAPAIFAWDGSVSAMRTYTADELLTLARSISGISIGGYEWEAGRFDVGGPYGLMPTTYLFGRPV
jgi:hypothetical protein